MKNRKRSDKAHPFPQGIAMGVVCTIMVLLAAMGILASLILNEKMQPEMIRYIPLCILALSAYIGGIVSNKMIMRQFVIVGFAQAAVMFTILLGLHIFFFSGPFESIPGTLISVGVGSLCACLTFLAPQKSKRKMRNR